MKAAFRHPMLKYIVPYIKILRLQNVLMAAVAVCLGYWLSRSGFSVISLLLLVVASIAATGYGNVINDIKDCATDRISHPDRPLPRGDISVSSASFYATLLVAIALTSAFIASSTHGLATFVPLAILTLYSFYLKRTPLIGNITVALLVAYALLFGGLMAPGFNRLLIPAFLAFLLNIAREIVKDIQDRPGDIAAGIITSAALPRKLLKKILYGISTFYFCILFTPTLLHYFGLVYAITCATLVVPLHILWLMRLRGAHKPDAFGPVSKYIKLEMLAGLVAITVDELYMMVVG
jgi:geranylgeranylglycerol-phosphate geranylgeranyltransferase